MNKQLRAAQDTLARLNAEAKEIKNSEEWTDAQRERADALPGEIEAAEADIKRIQRLEQAADRGDQFLNGNGAIQSIATTVANPSPEDEFKAAMDAKKRGHRASHFMKIEANREKANEKAFNFGMFVAGVFGNKNAQKYCQSQGLDVVAVHEEGVNERGGFLVPQQLDMDIIDLREVYGVFRQHARYTPMTSDNYRRPRRQGGLTPYFVGEGASITESTKNWGNVELTAKKLAVLTQVTSELNEDAAIDVGNDLAGEIAYAFALREDQCGFIGDGTSTYGGMTGITQRLIDVFTTSPGAGDGLIEGAGNAWSELTLANFHTMMGRLPLYAEPNAKFYCHKAFWETVMVPLALSKGGVPAAEIVNGIRRQFLGFDVVLSQAMPAAEANDQVPVVFGDLRLSSMFGDRRMTTIAMSEHHGFGEDVLWMRGTERFHINNHDVGADTVAGPVVGIITAGS